MELEWTRSTNRMDTIATEYVADLPDGYLLRVYRYKSITGQWVNEWAVLKDDGWHIVVEKDVTYGSLEDGKAAAEKAARLAV